MPEPGRRTSWASIGTVGEPKWTASTNSHSNNQQIPRSFSPEEVNSQEAERTITRNSHLHYNYRNNPENNDSRACQPIFFLFSSAKSLFTRSSATFTVVLISILVYSSLLIIWSAVNSGLFYLNSVTFPPSNSTSPVFSSFAAERLLANFASTPHYFGSEDNLKTRQFLIDTINVYKNLAESYKVNDYVTIEDDSVNVTCGGIYYESSNVIVKMKGAEDAGALLVSAHYDSVVLAPGVTDNGISVAAALETIRALMFSGKQLKYDVIFNFNNAEETGLWGGRAFIRHPLWKNVSAFINIEGTGAAANSRMLLFRTNSISLTKEWAQIVPYPHASVIANDVMSLIGSATDYQEYTVRGKNVPGLDLAFVTNRYLYHTPRDDLQHGGMKSMQTLGHNLVKFITTFCDSDKLLEVTPSSPLNDSVVPRANFSFFDFIGVYLFVETARVYQLQILFVLAASLTLALGKFAYTSIFGLAGAAIPLSGTFEKQSPIYRALKLYFKPWIKSFVLVLFSVMTSLLFTFFFSYLKSTHNPGATYGMPYIQVMWVIPLVLLSFIFSFVILWDFIYETKKRRSKGNEYTALPNSISPIEYDESSANSSRQQYVTFGSVSNADSDESDEQNDPTYSPPMMEGEAAFPWDEFEESDDDFFDDSEDEEEEEYESRSESDGNLVYDTNDDSDENYLGITDVRNKAVSNFTSLSEGLIGRVKRNEPTAFETESVEGVQEIGRMRLRENKRKSYRREMSRINSTAYTVSSTISLDVNPGARLESWLPYGILTFWLVLCSISLKLSMLPTPIHSTYIFSSFGIWSFAACMITWAVTEVMRSWWRTDILTSALSPLQTLLLYHYERYWWAVHLILSTTVPALVTIDSMSNLLQSVPSLIAERVPDTAVDLFFSIGISLLLLNLYPALYRSCVRNPTEESRFKLRKLRRQSKRRSNLHFGDVHSWYKTITYYFSYAFVLLQERCLSLWWSRPVAVILVSALIIWFLIFYIISLVAFPLSYERPLKSYITQVWDISDPKLAVKDGAASQILIFGMGPGPVEKAAEEMSVILKKPICQQHFALKQQYCVWNGIENPHIEEVNGRNEAEVRKLIKMEIDYGQKVTRVENNTRTVVAAAKGRLVGTPGSRYCQYGVKFTVSKDILNQNRKVIPEIWINEDGRSNWETCDGDVLRGPNSRNPFDNSAYEYPAGGTSVKGRWAFVPLFYTESEETENDLILITGIREMKRDFNQKDRRQRSEWFARLVLEGGENDGVLGGNVDVKKMTVIVSCWHGKETSHAYTVLNSGLEEWLTFASFDRAGFVEVRKEVDVELDEQF
ncbi:hypothetical protein HK098_003544 [Nowakowskiella sp. JEL0407]|nr:hypothetical protein HK098_003544 [Nowakowskiella sp. JEL0407]